MSSPVETALGTRPIQIAGRTAREVMVADLRITVTEGPDRGRAVSLAGASLLIGSASDADLVLTDPTVSRRHAVLRLTEDGATLEDLKSRNGTWVNNVRIETGRLTDGSTFRLGNTGLAISTSPARYVVYPSEEDRFHGLVGRSPAMREVFSMIDQLARTDLPVLVTGETGTGKELVARALHDAGPRRKSPFRVLDCASVRPELIRSELFGHEKGAFTGADAPRKGILEDATGGTVFLDEIGEMDLAIQPNLLRALEVREVTRMGASKPLPINIRLVSATNQDLARLTREGRFRSDLFFRLACVTLKLPALRERPEDIELLARHFVKACAERNASKAPDLTPAALDWLRTRAWSGNVRQLRNTMDAACMLAQGGAVDVDLLRRIGSGDPETAGAPVAQVGTAPSGESLPDRMARIEKDELIRALEASGWNKKAAARALGLSAATMFDKIKKYGIKGPDDV